MAPLAAFRTRVVLAGLVAALVVSGCAGERRAPFVSPSAPRAEAERSPAYRYAVAYEPKGQTLAVEATLPPGSPSVLAVEDGSERWLVAPEVKVAGASAFVPAQRTDDGMVRAECGAGCTVRYRYELGASGKVRRDIDSARTDGPYVEAPPSTWILAPVGGDGAARLSFTVHAPSGTTFVSGYAAAADGSRATTVAGLRRSPYSVFGPLDVVPIVEPDATFSLALPREGRRVAAETIVPWVEKSAAAVRAVLGAFPARHAALLVSVDRSDDVHVGFSLAGSSIVLRVGERTAKETLAKDWVLTHEMLHFAFPSQPDARDWAEEGMATYVEPFARARVGLVSREEAWEGLVRGFPNGQPETNDRGLDRTRTWGRVYWGGALFYFEADFAIRARTGGKKTLFDALAAIVANGGGNATSWPLERAFAVADEATGVPVLTEMLAKYGATAAPFPYEEHLAALGITLGPKGIVLDPKAPRAALVPSW